MIIIPSRRFIDVDSAPCRSSAEGWFTVRKIKHGHVVQEVTFQNLITNAGLNRLGTTQVSQIYAAAQVGDGTATPDVGDTELASFVAGQVFGTRNLTASGAPDFYSSHIMTALFSVGAVVGNITEVGVCSSSTGGVAFSRSLITDSGGNPIALTILADEQIEITYELRHYPPLDDNPATVTVGPNSHDTVTRALSANSNNWAFPQASGTNNATANAGNANNQRWYTGPLGAVTDSNPGGSVAKTISGLGTATYSSGSYQRDLSASSNPANGAVSNAGVIIIRSNCASFQVAYDPPLAKTAEQTLVVWTRFSWGRR